MLFHDKVAVRARIVDANDYVIDLGSSDGRTVIAARQNAPRVRSAPNKIPIGFNCRSEKPPKRDLANGRNSSTRIFLTAIYRQPS